MNFLWLWSLVEGRGLNKIFLVDNNVIWGELCARCCDKGAWVYEYYVDDVIKCLIAVIVVFGYCRIMIMMFPFWVGSLRLSPLLCCVYHSKLLRL